MNSHDTCYGCGEIPTFCTCSETILSPERWIEVLESRLEEVRKHVSAAWNAPYEGAMWKALGKAMDSLDVTKESA